MSSISRAVVRVSCPRCCPLRAGSRRRGPGCVLCEGRLKVPLALARAYRKASCGEFITIEDTCEIMRTYFKYAQARDKSKRVECPWCHNTGWVTTCTLCGGSGMAPDWLAGAFLVAFSDKDLVNSDDVYQFMCGAYLRE